MNLTPPERINPETQIPSYAAFAWQQNHLAEKRQWAGIAAVLPATFASRDDVVAALPAKEPINRFFRLVHSEAFR